MNTEERVRQGGGTGERLGNGGRRDKEKGQY